MIDATSKSYLEAVLSVKIRARMSACSHQRGGVVHELALEIPSLACSFEGIALLAKAEACVIPLRIGPMKTVVPMLQS